LSNAFEETDIEFDLGESDVLGHADMALTPSPPAGQVQPVSSPVAAPASPPASPPKLDGGVVLVVGADKEFVQRCHVALERLSVRLVQCTLMTATTRVEELRPFVIMVPDAVYAFDRFAFTKLAFESGSPLLVWERDLESDQVAALLETLRRKAVSPIC
jgi:hypothetical protein